jgi:hypothetical protein
MWGLMIVVSHLNSTIVSWAASDSTVVESELVITILHHEETCFRVHHRSGKLMYETVYRWDEERSTVHELPV